MQDDNALMERVKAGDKTAYDELVITYRLPAVSFAYSFVKDIYAAEDIVQDCFVKIYINRLEYNSSFSFITYLFTLIRNKSIDYLRKNKASRFVDLDSIGELTAGMTPEESILRNERISTILDKLQDKNKTALYLYAVHDLSYEQIARIMGKTVAQIKIIIFRARKNLKKSMGGIETDEN